MEFKKIKQTLSEHRQELKDKFKVKEIGVFGSYAKDEKTNKSDVDVLVDFYDCRIGKHILREVQYI